MSSKYWEVAFTSNKIQVPGNWPEHVARAAMIKATTDFINTHLVMVEPEPVVEIPEDVEVTFVDDGAVPQTAEGID